MSDNVTNQTQGQQQQQVLNVNVSSSGDPALEAHIFNKLYSAGRQIGSISSVVEVLLDALAGNLALATPAASTALEEFRAMQRQIAEVKRDRARAPETFIEQLETLHRDDPVAYQNVVNRLRSWLDAAIPVPTVTSAGGETAPRSTT